MNHMFPEIKKNFGFGMMRLPMCGDEVDIKQTCDMVDAFLAAGFNYFDTAHGYIGGKSEMAVKACLTDRYPRDSYILTDKLSPNFFKTEADIRPYLATMLEACGVEYFDFFLLHALHAGNYEHYTSNRAFELAGEFKAEGKVRHVGISFHDTADVLDRILTEQPVIEVVQLQFNYLDYEDENVQGRLCYEVCRKHGKPVIVMEPVRGGSLVNLPAAGLDVLNALGKDYSPAGYAIRYAASFEDIFMVLSGMSNMEQMQDNINTMKDFTPFDDTEHAAVRRVAEIIRAIPTIPCTGCRYCTDGDRCPAHIKIPSVFGAENKARRFSTSDARGYYDHVTATAKPTDCIGCGKCEKICPQQLPIRELLREIGERFEA